MKTLINKNIREITLNINNSLLTTNKVSCEMNIKKFLKILPFFHRLGEVLCCDGNGNLDFYGLFQLALQVEMRFSSPQTLTCPLNRCSHRPSCIKVSKCQLLDLKLEGTKEKVDVKKKVEST